MSLLKQVRAITIAGFDPSAGAGVLADVRTFAAFGLPAAAAITSITFQNSSEVFGAEHLSAEVVRAQLMPLLEGGRIVCAKTGMLPTREVVLEVARFFRESELPRPVVDPVIISSSGQRLMEKSALGVLIEELLPLAALITPNIPEAETLSGMAITSEFEMRQAAKLIRQKGAQAVLIKGGHLTGQEAGAGSRLREKTETSSDDESEAMDVLDNQGKVTVFRAPRIKGGELHGSGCILSAAIAAGLGKGLTLEEAVDAAKIFVLDAIRDT